MDIKSGYSEVGRLKIEYDFEYGTISSFYINGLSVLLFYPHANTLRWMCDFYVSEPNWMNLNPKWIITALLITFVSLLDMDLPSKWEGFGHIHYCLVMDCIYSNLIQKPVQLLKHDIYYLKYKHTDIRGNLLFHAITPNWMTKIIMKPLSHSRALMAGCTAMTTLIKSLLILLHMSATFIWWVVKLRTASTTRNCR